MALGRLHLITPPVLDEAAIAALDAALGAGAPVVQARLEGLTDADLLRGVARIRAACAAAGATCIVNDRVDLALAVEADGVHLGADDLPVAVARRLLGPDRLVGGTCRNADDARRARDAGASYVGAGPVHVSSTKAGLPAPIGPAGIEAIATAVDLPVIAISGVTVDNAAELRDAGAYGVAVIAAVFGADQPAAVTRALLDVLEPAGASSGATS